MTLPENLKSENVLLKLGMQFLEHRIEDGEKVNVFIIEKKSYLKT